jgi:small conductance mechanosensitive channel
MEQQLSTLQKLIDTAMAFFVAYSFQVLGAIIILILGKFAAGWLSKTVLTLMQKKNVDITLAKFLSGAVGIIVVGFALIIALGKFGITMAPFIAAVSAAALGASFALKGPLSNYGAGISIILSRPFTVGSTITVREVSGVVQEVTLACTRLINEDGVVITIPNNKVVGEILWNSKQNSVAEGVIGIGYDSSPETAIAAIVKVLGQFPEVTKTPAAQIGIESFGDSAINIGYRYWVPTVKFFSTTYAVNLAVFKALQAAKITIPFPQREVRLVSQTAPIVP